MKSHLEQLVSQAMAEMPEDILSPDGAPPVAELERTRDPRHGDFSTNIAMRMARAAGRNPRELAQMIIGRLPASSLVKEVNLAGPGFINFSLTHEAFCLQLAQILNERENYGQSDVGQGRKVLVEFVSANPTGPLHVGHGRHAAYGASVANLLTCVGYDVRREYYVNDAGRQMDILGTSVWLRYLQRQGEELSFPTSAYRGEYIQNIAGAAVDKWGSALRKSPTEVFEGLPADTPEGDKETHIDALIERTRTLLGPDMFRRVTDLALDTILADIKSDLAAFGVTFDQWFSERGVSENGAIKHALDKLRKHKDLYDKDGAVWFRASEYGDEKDRVVVRENGQTTYFASDIAYHLHKRERGHDLLLDVLGADHHGYVARVRAGLEAMGEPGDCLEVLLVQFVTLYRGGQKVQMSTRSGEFVSLRELREEVGDDAARFFYVMRSNDQHLDFDLELAKSESNENPVYYVQYAHARICSVLRQLEEKGWSWDERRGRENLDRLTERLEIALMSNLSRFPEVIESAASNRAPHGLVNYLRDLATVFHAYYNAHTFIVNEHELRDARLALISAARLVISKGLGLLGVSAPPVM